MVLKTFNLNEKMYKEFSTHCKNNGISMSKKVENFIKDELIRIKTRSGRRIRNIGEKSETKKASHHSFSKYC